MRNWNHKSWNIPTIKGLCFYSTYEELKPTTSLKKYRSAYSFYSTYEELKPPLPTHVIKTSLCFYSTYEELKLSILNSCNALINCFTVPEELKQKKGGKEYENQLVYSTYEVKPGVLAKTYIKGQVFTVPMRNWNSFFDSQYHMFTLFYSTYEELKPSSIIISGKFVIRFLQYLWGIETCRVVLLNYCYLKVFTVPMRNWNKTQFFLFFLIFYRFYSTYEELKQEANEWSK